MAVPTARKARRRPTLYGKIPPDVNENAPCCSYFWDERRNTFIGLSTRTPQRMHVREDRYPGLIRALLWKGLKIGLKRKVIASKRLPSHIYIPSKHFCKLACNSWKFSRFPRIANSYILMTSVMIWICGARS